MLERARSGGGDQGGALVVVLVTVVAFGLLLGSVLSLTTTSAQSVGLLGEQSQGRVDAESAHEIAAASLRKTAPAGPGTVCDPSTLVVTDGGSSSTVSCTTRVDASAKSPTADTTVLTTGTGSSDGIILPIGSNPRISGNVWSNGPIQGAGTLRSGGDTAALGPCLVTVTEESGTDGAVCDAANTLPTRVVAEGSPTVPTNTPAVPNCPSDARDTLVTFEPGVYKDARTISNLFSTCAGRDFWFKPGVYLFDFENASSGACATAAPGSENTAHRLCLNANGAAASRISAGTPLGWDPATAGARSFSSHWSSVTTDRGDFPNPAAALKMDDSYSAIGFPGTNVTTYFDSAAQVGSSTVGNSNIGNARRTNGAVGVLGFPATTPATAVTHTGSSTSSDGFSDPDGALVTDGGDAPRVARASVAPGGSARMEVAGFTSSTSAITASHLDVRLSAPSGSVRATITPGNASACGPVTLPAGAPDGNGYTRVSVDTTSCLGTPAAVNGAKVLLETGAGDTSSEVLVDGVAITSSVAPVRHSAAIRLANALSVDTKGRDTVEKMTLAVTHRTSQAGMGPRLVINNGTCSYPLTEGDALHTDLVDVTSCVGSISALSVTAVDVAASSVDGTTANFEVDGIDVQAVFTTTTMRTEYSVPANMLPSNAVSVDRLLVSFRGRNVGTRTDVTLRRPLNGGCGSLGTSTGSFFHSANYNFTGCIGGNGKDKVDAANAMSLVLYTNDGNSSGNPAFHMDGASFTITYRIEVQRIPDLSSGPGCVSTGTSPGVSFVFKGDSRMVLDSGTLGLCAPTADGVPSGPGITAVGASGCVLNGTCSVVTTGASGSQLSVHGSIFAPSARVNVGADAISAPLVTGGIVARSLTVNRYALTSGYNGDWIRNDLQQDLTAFSVPLVSTSPKLTERLRTTVEFGPLVKGRPPRVTAWEWKR